MTLRARLTAAASAAILLLLLLSAVVLYWRVSDALHTGVDDTVSRQAAAIAADTTSSTASTVKPVQGVGAVVQIVDSDGRVISTSADIDGEPRLFNFAVTSSGSRPTLRTIRLEALDDATFRVAGLEGPAPAHNLVYVAVPLSGVNRSTAELAGALVVGVPILTAALAALTWLLAGRALRPVETLRQQAASISVSDMRQRVDVPTGRDELSRLASTLNDLLDRLDNSLSRQRQFVADAAHELRSPIAAIRAQAEVADHVNGADEPSPLAAETVRLSRLADDLLALAHIDADPRRRSVPLDLDDLVFTEVNLLRERCALVVDTKAVTAVRVDGNSRLLTRAIRNLLDNAAKYARQRIVVVLSRVEGMAELSISDDGPGIRESDRERVLERFTRLDEARARDSGGVGLGLSIVDEVVNTHRGTLRIFDNRPGAKIVMRLPLDGSQQIDS